MEDTGRDRPRTMLDELLVHMEDAEEVADGIAQKYPEYSAMAEAVRSATEMVSITYEQEGYSSEREGGYG